MGLDTLFLIKLNDKEFTMGGKNIAFDCFYAAATIDLIKLLENGVSTALDLETKNQYGLVICSDEYDAYEPDVIIDFANKTVKIPMLKLQHAEDFEADWDARIISNSEGVFVDWGGDELEKLINAKEQIDKIYYLLSKEYITFEELLIYNNFIKWCDEQESTTFEYCDSLIYHYQQA